ncbi:MAG: hypothetical protein GX775_01080 [Erysipelothrix sp.]|nr:hypothetical protein [Erysipelothrix sp.]
MKKTITIILTSLLIVTFLPTPLDIQAKETSDNNTIIEVLEESSSSFSDYRIVEDNDDLVKISMVYEDGEVYYTFIESNRVYVTDSKGNELGSLYLENPILFEEPLYNIASTESWGSYFYYGYRNSHISWQEGLAIDVAVGVILSLITGGLSNWIGISVGAIGTITSTIAIQIYNSNTKNLRYSRYISQWVGCPILMKDRIQIHNQSMSQFFGTKYINPYWIGSKWDYGQPSECRQTPY